MQITVNREELLQAVSSAQHVVERRHTLPILSHLLFEATERGLSITATDMEIALKLQLDVPAEREGRATIQARKLFDILRELPDGRVTIEQLDGFVSLRSASSRFRLHSLSAEDFPSFSEEEPLVSVSLRGEELASMIAATSYAASNDETRRYLTGVLFEIRDGQMRLVATDGHRLALRRLGSVAAEGSIQCIVPRKAVQEIRRLGERAEEVLLEMGENQLRVVSEGFRFSCRLIAAKFPDYEEVLPSGYSNRAIVEREVLDRALRRAMVVVDEFPHTVELSFSERGIEIVARNIEQEEAQDRIDAEYEGSPKRFGFNARYLRDALAAIEGDRVCFEVGQDESEPSVLYGDENERHVVMPMRL